jgi:hypothetical protein
MPDERLEVVALIPVDRKSLPEFDHPWEPGPGFTRCEPEAHMPKARPICAGE